MKSLSLLLAAALALSPLARSEDYQCGSDAGCVGRITEDGEVHDITFRKGDMVSTDAGWSVSTDDGWVKVKTNWPRRSGSGPAAGKKLVIGELILWDHMEIHSGTFGVNAPSAHAWFLRPTVSIAAQPPEMCLIGL